jgi:glycosyltransferase involved in cell wall biosynthesis
MLQQRGIPTYVADETQVKDVIERGRFDLALLTFWRIAEAFLPVIRRVSPSTFIIVDSIDLHFVRGARQVLRRERQTAPPMLLTDDYGRELVREINSYVAADAVLAVSTKERDLINDLTSDPRLAHCVPLCEDLEESTVPLETRKGIIFIGNFWHRPNVEAIEHLCYQIRPRLPEAVLAEHPIQIIGNGVNETVRQLGRLPHVLVVGWVPSIAPYLGRARMSVVPLLHGAGTKGKVLQALMAGTPTVSTPMGQEGLDLVDDRDILIADTADVFAKSIVRLAADDDLWRRLAHSGRSQIAAVHSREAIRNRLSEVFRTVLAKSPKAAPVSRRPEAQLIDRLRDVISRAVPANATLVVVSKGDEALLDLGVRQSWHFPRTSSGGYAGHYPADSEAAIAHLEDLRAQGGTHLLFPQTALWWLDHYRGLRQHLARHYQEEFLGDDLGLLYSLERSSTVPTTVVSSAGEEIVPSSKVSARTVQTAWDDTTIARLRPTVAHASPLSDSLPDPIRNVLVLGVYLANQKNNVSDIVDVLSSATKSNHAAVDCSGRGAAVPKCC